MFSVLDTCHSALYTTIMTLNTEARALRNRVRERRVGLAMTQVDLAARVGISRTTLSAIEQDNGYPLSMPIALRLASELGVDVGWLFYEEQAS
jgi:DNA-binding XRE family transcriptional regulator